jgi:hypothetical protein
LNGPVRTATFLKDDISNFIPTPPFGAEPPLRGLSSTPALDFKKEQTVKLDAPYSVSEWQWLKLQLTLHKLESRCFSFYLSYTYDEREGNIICDIWANPGYEQTKIGNREKLKDIYDQHVLFERNVIHMIIEGLPVLRQEFDVKKNVTIQFLESNGMGSTLICEYRSSEVIWHYPFKKES